MIPEEAVKKLPPGGLLKKTRDAEATSVTEAERVVLIRKGNEVFNRGDIALAERIYRTTRYAAGLARVGDWYVKQNRPLEALSAFRAGHCRGKMEVLLARMARVVRDWLKEEGRPAANE